MFCKSYSPCVMSSAPLVKMAGEYEKLKLLGSGSYGKAWLVNCRSKKRHLVLKEIKLDSLNDKEIGQTLVEVKVLAKCRHVNIISYCEAFSSSCILHIIMEYAENGDLQKKILEQRGIHFNAETILDWFIQICFALKYLHGQNILHRDLKPQNLFLTSDGIVKVGDFGIARILQDTGDHAITAIGTPYYLSPEICRHKPYDSKSDMWSAGCVLYELCCLRVPFHAPNLPLLVLTILEGHYDPIPSHFGAVLEDLVGVLLKSDPLQRPTAQQVLNVPSLQPQVVATYRRCLRHKQQRRHQHQRLSAKDPGSPGVFSPKEVDKFSLSHRTYTIKSPLVRRLSVATPKLKAAIKRQCSAWSAEPAPTRKRRKESSRPLVFNLQEAILAHQPTCHSSPELNPPHTHHSEGMSYPPAHNKDSCVSTSDPDSQCRHESYDSDNVFEDGEDVPKGDRVLDNKCVFSTSSSPENVEGSSRKTHGSAYCKVEDGLIVPSTAVPSTVCRGMKDNHIVQLSAPGTSSNCRKDSDSVPSDFLQPSCIAAKNIQHDADGIGDSPTSVANGHHGVDREKKQQEQDHFPALEREQEGRCNENSVKKQGVCFRHPGRQACLTSDTYTVLSSIQTDGQQLCPRCTRDKPPQPCLHQALYRATALSYTNRGAAQRCLSQFLIAHLGSELSLRLCSLVNVALHAGEEYGTLETHLDEECRVYLPVIFYLLSWSEDMITKTKSKFS